MNCPNCGAPLRERDRAGVKIDFCPECKGVWLDRGELDKIIQIELADAEASAPAGRDRGAGREDDDDDDEWRDRGGLRDGGRREPRSRKRSFFEGLTEMMGGGGMED